MTNIFFGFFQKNIKEEKSLIAKNEKILYCLYFF